MADINEAKRALLQEWERERDDLNLMINRLRRELGLSESRIEPEAEAPIRTVVPTVVSGITVEELVTPGDFFGMTQIAAAKGFLQRRTKQPASLEDIAAALYRGKAIESPIDDTANLSSMLSRSDEFISVARGRWGLAEWYPGKSKKRKGKNGDPTPAQEDKPSGEKPSENVKTEEPK
ncbi:MAG: hypothetical protein Q7S58_14775 [Candidatus Binatus sp.]|uniref:hypothetical protein n=1 Tax=Candidatus Binatus sp. TaxID=2811406 RepID=UPI002723EE0E|nr:hypothetical protein [Candidatus Binatus sp.]MDO8433666.1 hypothetical protein [Candidatus Binatus sp.]